MGAQHPPKAGAPCPQDFCTLLALECGGLFTLGFEGPLLL